MIADTVINRNAIFEYIPRINKALDYLATTDSLNGTRSLRSME